MAFPRPPTDAEWQNDFLPRWPYLNRATTEITAPKTDYPGAVKYNCIAYSMGVTDQDYPLFEEQQMFEDYCKTIIKATIRSFWNLSALVGKYLRLGTWIRGMLTGQCYYRRMGIHLEPYSQNDDACKCAESQRALGVEVGEYMASFP